MYEAMVQKVCITTDVVSTPEYESFDTKEAAQEWVDQRRESIDRSIHYEVYDWYVDESAYNE